MDMDEHATHLKENTHLHEILQPPTHNSHVFSKFHWAPGSWSDPVSRETTRSGREKTLRESFWITIDDFYIGRWYKHFNLYVIAN